MEEDNVTIKYFKLENVSINGFTAFCKKNIPLIFAVSIALFFIYGIRLFWYSIGYDTDLFMEDKSEFLTMNTLSGRWGLTMLINIWYIKEFNPFAAFFVAFCLIWLFTISWCYIIAIFSGDTDRNNKLIPFALVFITMPIWVDQFYFILQSAEIAFVITLCPFIIYFLYKGFLENQRGKIICAFVLLVFIFSVYQAMIPLFCCGVFLCFLLLMENTEYKPKIYWNLCLKLIITAICAFAIYFIIFKIITTSFMGDRKVDYLNSFFMWGQMPVMENIRNLFKFVYVTTIGGIPLVQKLVAPYTYSEGTRNFMYYLQIAKVHGNSLLLPAVLFFYFKMTVFTFKAIPKGRRILYFLAGICIPLTIILLTLTGGAEIPIRSVFSLPLAFAFMLYYLIVKYNRKIAVVIYGLALLIAINNAQIGAQLFFSDQMRYNEDVRLAYQLNDLILQAQPENGKLPVAFIGRYKTSAEDNVNFLKGEIIGNTVFSWIWKFETTKHCIAFMNSVGFYLDTPDENSLKQAKEEALSMPSYPDNGCVKRYNDCIIVKLSDY